MLQTILFPKSKFSYHEALVWLTKHHYRHHKVDETEHMYRFRQMEPMQGGYYRTVTLPNGIELVSHYEDNIYNN